MTYEILKYILWGLLCLPVLVIGILCIDRLINEGLKASPKAVRKVRKSEIRRMDAERKKTEAAEQERRRKFDEEYRKKRGI